MDEAHSARRELEKIMEHRKVTLIGGPAAGDIIESQNSRIMVPVLNDLAVVMPNYIPPLLKGFVTYRVQKVRFGSMSWFVAKPEGDTAPVSPLAILRGARPTMYIFGKQN